MSKEKWQVCSLAHRCVDSILEIYFFDSVRAWRGLRFNEKYAKKLEAKLARKKQKEEEKEQVEKARQEKEAAQKVNPFSVS